MPAGRSGAAYRSGTVHTPAAPHRGTSESRGSRITKPRRGPARTQLDERQRLRDCQRDLRVYAARGSGGSDVDNGTDLQSLCASSWCRHLLDVCWSESHLCHVACGCARKRFDRICGIQRERWSLRAVADSFRSVPSCCSNRSCCWVYHWANHGASLSHCAVLVWLWTCRCHRRLLCCCLSDALNDCRKLLCLPSKLRCGGVLGKGIASCVGVGLFGFDHCCQCIWLLCCMHVAGVARSIKASFHLFMKTSLPPI